MLIRSTKDRNIRVLLLEAGSEGEKGIPPNLAVIVSNLLSHGVEVKVFSTNLYRQGRISGDSARLYTLQVPPSDEEHRIAPKAQMLSNFLLLVENFKPDIIGLSATEPTYLMGLQLLKSLKDNKVLKIVGGAHATLNPLEVLGSPLVDGVCIGEGENVLLELCLALETGRSDYYINGFWFKRGNEVIKNPLDPLLSLDEVVFQNWSPWSVPPRASKPMLGKVRMTALVELSRGCPFSCTYCANRFLNTQFKGNYRERSVEKFVQEVICLQRSYGVEFIYIADETILTTTQKRLSEFVEQYGRVKLPFWCETRPENVTRERIKMLSTAGLEFINVGVESGDEWFRKQTLNRNISDDAIVASIDDIKSEAVKVGANIIIGFPGETRANIFKSIDLIRDARPDSSMIHLFQPYRRTELREKSIQKGLISSDYVCGDYRFDAVGTGYLSGEDVLGLQRTFNLYVDLPPERWGDVEIAESFSEEGNQMFYELAREYQLKHFGRTSF